jgi:hypothetical protein
VDYSRKSLENWLNILEYLREVILLYKGTLLTRTINKYQGTFIAISNYSPYIDRYYIIAVKLILYIY